MEDAPPPAASSWRWLWAVYACGVAGAWLLRGQRPPQRAREEEEGEVERRQRAEWDVVRWEDAPAEHAE